MIDGQLWLTRAIATSKGVQVLMSCAASRPELNCESISVWWEGTMEKVAYRHSGVWVSDPRLSTAIAAGRGVQVLMSWAAKRGELN